MNITLNSSDAQTLYNTRRLIRTVDCELENDLPRGYHVIETRLMFGKWYVICENAEKLQDAIRFTPPLEVGAVYDVIEPCFSTEVRSNSLVITYGDSPVGKHASGTASRQQATPTYKLILEEGKLRCYEELKRV